MRFATRWVLLGLLVAPLAGMGCTKALPKPVPVEVQGTLTTESGKPLDALLLRFHPQEEKNATGSVLTCVTEEKGTFVGQCLPGKYKVTVLAIPVQYGGSPASVTTTATVGKSTVTLQGLYNSPADTPLEIDIPAEGKRNVVFKVKTR